jgi:hypothetical protein
MGKEAIVPRAVGNILAILLVFGAGFFTHVLYQRWNPPTSDTAAGRVSLPDVPDGTASMAGQAHRVTYMPLAQVVADGEQAAEVPAFVAKDVEKIRVLTGKQARVRGRVFRVGHSAKSNTYFLNFGPSREALTAVIFSSGVELFEKSKLLPKNFENKEIEVIGEIKDHPQYGLEIIIENPKQLKILH